MWLYSIVIFHLVSIFNFYSSAAYGINLQGGILTYVIIFCLFIIKTIFNKRNKHYQKLNILDILICSYVIWNIITLVNVLIFDKSIIVYLKGISYTLFPIFGYYVFSFQNNPMDITIIDKYFYILILSTIIAVLIGIYFYFSTSELYLSYIQGQKPFEDIVTNPDQLYLARLQSYFGSSAVGNISAISIPLIIYLFNKKYINIYLMLLFLAVLYAGVILSFSRSAWVTTIIISLFHILYLLKKHFIKIVIIALVFFVALQAILFGTILTDNIYVEGIQTRIYTIPDSFRERSNQVEYGLKTFEEYPIGIGLGQAGHKSITDDSSEGVSDNNYMRIFAETSVIGIILFTLIMLFSLFLIFNYLFYSNLVDHLSIAIGSVLFIFYFQALGTNIFDVHYSSYLFWSFLGILSLKNKYYNSKLRLHKMTLVHQKLIYDN